MSLQACCIGIQSCLACYIPQRTRLTTVMLALSTTGTQAVRSMLDDFPSSSHTLTDGGHTPGEGADFVVTKVTETITKVTVWQVLYRACYTVVPSF